MTITIMPGEVTPTLFVGLGGSGGRAIGRIARRLRDQTEYELRYRDLVRFIAIDTNDADLARLRKGGRDLGRVDDTVLISDFDKVAYATLRRGETFTDADPYFTQWVPEWYRFRPESGAGAGQIRVESRLAFFRAVEVGKLTQQLADVINGLKSHAHGMKKFTAPIQAFVYFSVAGGTGSGAFVPLAYLLRDLLGDEGARLVGFAILPEAFEEAVGMNRDGAFANGYAALKELEHMMRLDTQSPASPKQLPFHYDPRNKSKTTVARRPYDLIYLVDRPRSFALDGVAEALADASYVQIFSPILGDQQADYDNYTKHSRALFPPELKGDGYTAFYGTLGAAMLLLPRGDVLAYCARRFAATAVRRYLLLDDPGLVSAEQWERLKQFNVDREELERLSPDVRAERLDGAFRAKMDFLAEKDREGGVWKRLLAVKASAAAKLADALRALEEDLRGGVVGVREISADRILDGAWTPATTIQSLNAEMTAARELVRARAASLVKQVEGGDWWSQFLATAGTDAVPELSPYEQRYVLIAARDGATGALAPAKLDELSRTVARLRAESDLGDGRFRAEMDAHAEQLKKTHGGLDKLLTGKDKDFDAARDRAVATFNEFVQKVRVFLVKASLYDVVSAIGRGADAMRASFRNIEAEAGRLANELEEKARRFELEGGESGASEANDFSLDTEVLQHPSGRMRFWSWYYEDQVATRTDQAEQREALAAVRDAMRPRFDDRGRAQTRTARDMVADIEHAMVRVAERLLKKTIAGDPTAADPAERAGLRLDDALALEARYYELYNSSTRDQYDGMAALRRARPLSPTALWSEDAVQQYARKKVENVLAKAEPLTRYSPEHKSTIAHADMLVIGMHASLRSGPFASALHETLYGKNAAELGDWADPQRIVFYRSILGVPLYCFPHINRELKAAYHRHQANPARAWPLHIDRNWESLPDLDPDERRRARDASTKKLGAAVTALALGCARGGVEQTDGAFALRLEGGGAVQLGRGVLAAARALQALEGEKPAVYKLGAAHLFADAAHAAARPDVRDAVAAVVKTWTARCVHLELAERRSAEEEREYGDLREALDLAGAPER